MTGRKARLARLEAHALPSPAELSAMSDDELRSCLVRLDCFDSEADLRNFQIRLEAMTDAELLAYAQDHGEA